MRFRIEKFALASRERGESKWSEGIQIPDNKTMKDTEETDYKIQRVLDGHIIEQKDMKKNIKEYMKGIKAVFKSKLNAITMVKAINTLAVPIHKMQCRQIRLEKSEFQTMDLKTRKTIEIYLVWPQQQMCINVKITKD